MKATVYIVDDSKMARDSLSWLLDSAQLQSKSFEDGQSFIENKASTKHGCIVLDIRMPKLDGMAVMEHLNSRRSNHKLPIIIMTGYADVPLATKAMKAGAFDLVEKPYSDDYMLERIQAAIRFNAEQVKRRTNLDNMKTRFSDVTPREMEVMKLVAHGESNKSIAEKLHISHKTVELHRSNLLHKSNARSSTELVRLAVLAGIIH